MDYVRTGRSQDAEACYRRSIALLPSDSAAPTRNLARVLVETSRHAEAIPILEQTIANDRKSGEADSEAAALVALGLAHERLQSASQQALEAFARAVALVPNGAEQNQFLGMAYLKKTDSGLSSPSPPRGCRPAVP